MLDSALVFAVLSNMFVSLSSAEHCQQSTYANATVFLVLKNTLHAATANQW